MSGQKSATNSEPQTSNHVSTPCSLNSVGQELKSRALNEATLVTLVLPSGVSLHAYMSRCAHASICTIPSPISPAIRRSTHACMHARMHAGVHMCIHSFAHTCTHARRPVSILADASLRVCIHTTVHLCMYGKMYVILCKNIVHTHTQRHVYSFFVHRASALTHAAASSPGCEGLAGSSHCIGQVKVAASGRTTGSIASTCRHQYRLLRHRGMAESITLTVTITRHRKTHDAPKTVVVIITAIVRTSLLAASRSLYRSIQKTMAQ